MKKNYHIYQFFMIAMLVSGSIFASPKTATAARLLDLIDSAAAQRKKKVHAHSAGRVLELIHEAAKQSNPGIKAQKLLKKFAHKTKIEKKAKHELANRPMKIEKVKLMLDAHGYPTIKAIKELILNHYLPKTLADSLEVEAIAGGAFSEKLYKVAVKGKNKNIFFVKISSAPESATNLEKIQKSLVGRLGIDTRYAQTKKRIPRKNLPIMIWIEQFFSYADAQGKDRFIELTHSAHGQPVYTILTGADQKLKELCSYRIGITLGSFQQAFMNYHGSRITTPASDWTTICHNDFHPGNILFDPKTERVYFIDNERMSSEGCHINNDLHVLPQFYESTVFEQWFKAILSLYKGYIASFPDDQKAAVAKYLNEGSALEHGDPIVRNIFQGYLHNLCIEFDPNAQRLYHISPLHIAVSTGDIREAKKLLRDGANVNAQDDKKTTAIDIAVINGNQEMIKLLVSYGSRINEVNAYGCTALGFAASINDTKTIATLLNLGANVNALGKYQETALLLATQFVNKAAIDRLLKTKNIDLNIQDKDGNSALQIIMYAYHRDLFSPQLKIFLEIAQSLIDAGASTTIRNNAGDTPLQIGTTNYAHLLKIPVARA